MSGEIPFHLRPAERPFDRIDRSILITIELLKMVVGQPRIVRVRNPRTKMISARIVALGAFQHSVVHEVGSRLHDSFRRQLLMNLRTSRSLRTRWLELSQYRLGLLLNSLLLVLRSGTHGTLLSTLDWRGLLLLGLLWGRLGNGEDRSRLLCFFSFRKCIAYRDACEGYQTGTDEYPQIAAHLRQMPPT